MKHRDVALFLSKIICGVLIVTVCYLTNDSYSEFRGYTNDSSVYGKNSISELDNVNVKIKMDKTKDTWEYEIK